MNEFFIIIKIINNINLKASLYDLNLLGYTRITNLKTNRNKCKNKNKSRKIKFVLII